MRNFYDPYFVEPNFELEQVGSKFDFDSVTATTLGRFPFVLTTLAAYASGAPPGYDPMAETDSYVLWKRGGDPGGRRPGETDAQPGRVDGCRGPAKEVATFTEEPVLSPADEWTASTIESGERAELEIGLPPGPWNLSLEYDSTRPLTLSAPRIRNDAARQPRLSGHRPVLARRHDRRHRARRDDDRGRGRGPAARRPPAGSRLGRASGSARGHSCGRQPGRLSVPRLRRLVRPMIGEAWT